MTNKPTNTKAAADKPVDEKGTKLADVPNPAKLTDAKIKQISGDDGSEEAENSANKDAAEAMKQDRAEAKGKDDTDCGYFGGQGGAAGL